MMTTTRIAVTSLALALFVSSACGKRPSQPEAQPQSQAADQPKPDEGPSADILSIVNKPWTGDFDQMTQRRLIRALVVYNKTYYFLDGPNQKGATYDSLKAFEDDINKKLTTGHLKVHIVFVPVTRDQLLPSLVAGRGDIAAANLTVTPERSQMVDFGDALLSNVSEVVVTGPTAPPLTSLDDLGGQQIYVREASSAYESLIRLNLSLKTSGKPQIQIEQAPTNRWPSLALRPSQRNLYFLPVSFWTRNC